MEMVGVDSSFQKFDAEKEGGNWSSLNTSWHGKDCCHKDLTNGRAVNDLEF